MTAAAPNIFNAVLGEPPTLGTSDGAMTCPKQLFSLPLWGITSWVLGERERRFVFEGLRSVEGCRGVTQLHVCFTGLHGREGFQRSTNGIAMEPPWTAISHLSSSPDGGREVGEVYRRG